MFRKMITLLLFTTTVPFAAFGAHGVDVIQVKSWVADAGLHAASHWPAVRNQLERSVPSAVQDVAASLNDYSPGAGGDMSPSCRPVANWQIVTHQPVLFSI